MKGQHPGYARGGTFAAWLIVHHGRPPMPVMFDAATTRAWPMLPVLVLPGMLPAANEAEHG